MAIALDATGGTDVNDDNFTFAHTCTGSDLILWVGWWQDSQTVTASSVTYNGDAMTATSNSPYTPDTGRHYLYYLVNPDTGTNNVEITLSSATVIRVDSASFTGAKQTGVPDAVGANKATSATSLTTTFTTVAENCFLYGNGRENVNGNTDPGTDTSQAEGGGNETSSGFYSTNARAAGSNSIAFTTGPSATNMSMIAASFAPAAAAAGFVPGAAKSLLGVGI